MPPRPVSREASAFVYTSNPDAESVSEMIFVDSPLSHSCESSRLLPFEAQSFGHLEDGCQRGEDAPVYG